MPSSPMPGRSLPAPASPVAPCPPAPWPGTCLPPPSPSTTTLHRVWSAPGNRERWPSYSSFCLLRACIDGLAKQDQADQQDNRAKVVGHRYRQRYHEHTGADAKLDLDQQQGADGQCKITIEMAASLAQYLQHQQANQQQHGNGDETMQDMNGAAGIVFQYAELVIRLVVLMTPEREGFLEIEMIGPAVLADRQLGADHCSVIGRGPTAEGNLQDHCRQRGDRQLAHAQYIAIVEESWPAIDDRQQPHKQGKGSEATEQVQHDNGRLQSHCYGPHAENALENNQADKQRWQQ